MLEVLKCKKCGKEKQLINNLCNSCYQKYKYRHNRYGMSLKEFIYNDTENHYKMGNQPKIDDNLIKEFFEKGETNKVSKFCKSMGISRQTYYNRLKILGLKK